MQIQSDFQVDEFEFFKNSNVIDRDFLKFGPLRRDFNKENSTSFWISQEQKLC